MDTLPRCRPAEIGENVTLMVQLAPAARLVPQVLVSAKGALVVMPVMLTAVAAVLVSVVVCAALVVPTPWLSNSMPTSDPKDCGENVRVTPVPCKLMLSGPSGALEATVKLPPRKPTEVGAKVTLMIQLAPPATEVPHVLPARANSAPLIVMLVMDSAVGPVLRKTAV